MDAKDAMISLLAQHGIVPKHYVRGTAIACMGNFIDCGG